jgi:uncharacterized protein
MLRRFGNRHFRLILFLLGVWLVFDLLSHFTTEILWFREVDYLSVFWLRLNTRFWLWAIAFLICGSFMVGNLFVAARYRHHSHQENLHEIPLFSPISAKNVPSSLKLTFLLPALLILSLLAAWVLVDFTQQVWDILSPNFKLPHHVWELPNSLQVVFKGLGFSQISLPIVPLVLLLVVMLVIWMFPLLSLKIFAGLNALLLAFICSAHWDKFLQFFHATSFNFSEPLFNADVGFYVFKLPIWELIESIILRVFIYSITATLLVYLRSGNSLSQGKFIGFSIPQRLHLNILGCCLMMAVGFQYWLWRYSLLYSKRGVSYGASYTAVKIELPIYALLSWLAVAIALYLLLLIFVLQRRTKKSLSLTLIPRHLVYTLSVYILIAATSGEIIPSLVQRFIVQPNELLQETPYINRSIALTRKAFNLDAIEARTFNPEGTLTKADLAENNSTIRNIRLWDTSPLLRTNRQLQQIRPYYSFPGADIDRYTLQQANGKEEKQQTIIAARELDYTGVPQLAKTWVNEHLVYTHGYGFTLSPVNTVGSGGLPDYFVKDIGSDTVGDKGSLRISNQAITNSIPIGKPRIYYGENTHTYVMTGTKTGELDYPSGGDNVYNVYDGRGGVAISSIWRRVLFAKYLKDWQMLLTRNFTPETKLLFRRNITERVREIAPFLHYDSDPYLVAADGGGKTLKGEKTYLYWILDAYTTSDRYPYSDPGDNPFNYIRNSVKVIIDAYNGNVSFYITDPTDPIIATLRSIFPNLFQPLSKIPTPLRNHLRYPVDLFAIQSERLLTYHMTDPQVFYNREDLWQVPTEIYGTKPRPVAPYFLITKLLSAETEEFILLLPFTPTKRQNLIAWLAARSDNEEYGKLLLYTFPKQQLVYGTEQIEALINQDPEISGQITLWNREGSRVIQGNLLIIPIGGCAAKNQCTSSLLYVEPLYLEAEKNSLPTLIRVVVAYQNRIVMAETLEQGLSNIFATTTTPSPAPAIVRPLQ